MILFLYVLREYFRYVTGSTAITVFLIVLFDFIHKSSRYFIRYNPDFLQVFLLYLYQLPNIIAQTLPVSSLLSSVIVMVILSRTNEVTAMRSVGMGPLKVGLPLACGGLFLCLISTLLGEFVVPISSNKVHFVESVMIEKNDEQSFLEGARWIRNNQYLYNFKDYSAENNKLIDVKIIALSRPFIPKMTIVAESAVYQKQKMNWALSAVTIYYFWPNGTLSYKENKNSFEVQIPIDPTKLQKERRLPSEMSFRELNEIVKRDKSLGYDILSMQIEMQVKRAFYFASFVVSLIGLKFGYRNERSLETARSILIAILIGMSYWFVLSAGKAMARRGIFDPSLGAWASNILLLSISAVSIRKLCRM